MKISLIGYGTMGKLVEEAAISQGIEIISIVDPYQKEASHPSIEASSMRGVDVCICFSHPSSVLSVVEGCCLWQRHLVLATTGWLDQYEEIKQKVLEAKIGVVYSSNFSLGVNLFFKMLEKVSKIMNHFEQYDVLGFEFHHNRKVDSPSGTAKTITNIVLDQIERKSKVVENKLDRKIQHDEFHFASVRGGDIPGTHSLIFDSEFDSIEIKHQARNRLGFATGSILAAKWLLGKTGMYTENDMMNAILKS